MPVIVVGADTEVGTAIIDELMEPDREIRAFVTSPDAARAMRELGVKVALGDVSDASHVEAASLNCFSAVLVTEAATDGRERAFAKTSEAVIRAWSDAVRGVRRVIWVGAPPSNPAVVAETTAVDRVDDARETARRVARLDGMSSGEFSRAVSPG